MRASTFGGGIPAYFYGWAWLRPQSFFLTLFVWNFCDPGQQMPTWLWTAWLVFTWSEFLEMPCFGMESFSATKTRVHSLTSGLGRFRCCGRYVIACDTTS